MIKFRLQSILTVLSALLMVVTLGLFFRSYSVEDDFYRDKISTYDGTTYHLPTFSFACAHGTFVLTYVDQDRSRSENRVEATSIDGDPEWFVQIGLPPVIEPTPKGDTLFNRLGFGCNFVRDYSVAPRVFRTFYVPILMFPAMFSLLPAIAFRKWVKQQRRIVTGRCGNCGYDVRATRDRCPECGTPMDELLRSAAHKNAHGNVD